MPSKPDQKPSPTVLGTAKDITQEVLGEPSPTVYGYMEVRNSKDPPFPGGLVDEENPVAERREAMPGKPFIETESDKAVGVLPLKEKRVDTTVHVPNVLETAKDVTQEVMSAITPPQAVTSTGLLNQSATSLPPRICSTCGKTEHGGYACEPPDEEPFAVKATKAFQPLPPPKAGAQVGEGLGDTDAALEPESHLALAAEETPVGEYIFAIEPKDTYPTLKAARKAAEKEANEFARQTGEYFMEPYIIYRLAPVRRLPVKITLGFERIPQRHRKATP